MSKPPVAYFSYFRLIDGPPAATVHIMKMCQAFAEEGYPTTLHAPAPISEYQIDDLWARYGIHTQFDLKFFKANRFLRRYDVSLQSVFAAKQRKNTIAYARNPLAGMMAARMGLPTVADAHGPPPSGMGKHHFRGMFSSKNFIRLVTITEPLRQIYLELHPSRLNMHNTIVNPNGADLKQFEGLPEKAELRRELGLPEDIYLAGYVGGLYSGRGVEVIIGIAKQMPEVTFVLTGGNEQDIATWRKKLHGQENIIFTGAVDNTLVPRYLCAADVLLMPYQTQVYVYGNTTAETSRYMSPLKMFDYLAAQRPIVSSDIPVLREVLNENNAVLCAPAEVEQWVHAIKRLREQPDWSQQIAIQARRDAEKHTWRARVRRVLDGIV